MKHLVNINDLSVSEISNLIAVGEDISKDTRKYSKLMQGKILASLFFEASTRTRLSFESAMIRLGGQVIGFSEAANTSVAKGESLKDTVRTVEQYSDIIAMRHPKEGSAAEAASVLGIPFINAGDGKNQHPTQTLTDLLTIKKEKGRLNNLKIALIGDLKNGRTVHSLLNALCRFEANSFYFVSPDELKMPEIFKSQLDETSYSEHRTLEEVISDADVIYMTRIQKERFDTEEAYLKHKGIYVLDAAKMSFAKKDAIVMHPLPRVDEIAEEVDSDSRAKYFTQAQNGVYVRMALIIKMVCQNEFHVPEDIDVMETKPGSFGQDFINLPVYVDPRQGYVYH